MMSKWPVNKYEPNGIRTIAILDQVIDIASLVFYGKGLVF